MVRPVVSQVSFGGVQVAARAPSENAPAWQGYYMADVLRWCAIDIPNESPIAKLRRALRSGPVLAWTEPHEPADGPWLRGIVVVMSLGAGLIHLAVVSEHVVEGWVVAGFFVAVGIGQLAAAGLLLWSRPASWLWLGIAGTATVIGVWVVSRTVGLPFASTEPVGMTDSAATLMEVITIVVLALWLRSRSRSADERGLAVAIGSTAFLGLGWWVSRSGGLFEPDPIATLLPPEFIDRVAVPLSMSVAGLLALMWPAIKRGSWWRPLMRGLLGAVGLMTLTLVAFTLPTQSGQNVDCRYGPLAEFTGHEEQPIAVRLADGESRWLPLVSLTACPGQSVTLAGFEALNVRGAGGQIVEMRLLPVGGDIEADGLPSLPATADVAQDLPLIQPDESRQLVVLVLGRGRATFNIDAVAVAYRLGSQTGTFTFATSLSVCGPGACPDASPGD